MVRPLLRLGNPKLWEPSRPVEPPDAGRVVADLRDTLADVRFRYGFGRGIAAPQIGEPVRVVWALREALVNPRIVAASPEMLEIWDDCFCFPELAVRVRRHAWVRVRYQDLDGVEREWHAEDARVSELLQHELDHLDGTLAVDRAASIRDVASRAEVFPDRIAALTA